MLRRKGDLKLRVKWSSLHYFEHGEINNGVLMAAAGKYGNYLGEVNLTFEAHKVVHKTAK
nr:hypothetical protein [Staphylococcus aureus]